MNDRARRWRCGRARPSQRTITAVIAFAWLIGATPAAAQTSPSAASPLAIEIRAEPITGFDLRDPSRRQFGLLEFRGGLLLRSPARNFGGLSAIRVAADGAHFIALTDKGWWFRGRLLYAGSRPSGIADAEMAPILGADGRPLAARGWYDTEAIAEDGGTLYVGIERVHQIVRFNYGKEGLLARGQAIASPPGLRSLPANKGIEALVFVPKGLPLAGTLRSRSRSAVSTRQAISTLSLSAVPRPVLSRSSAARATTSPTLPSCPAATFSCLSGDLAGPSALPSDSAASRWATSSQGRWPTVPFCSRRTSATRSTTWKA